MVSYRNFPRCVCLVMLGMALTAFSWGAQAAANAESTGDCVSGFPEELRECDADRRAAAREALAQLGRSEGTTLRAAVTEALAGPDADLAGLLEAFLASPELHASTRRKIEPILRELRMTGFGHELVQEEIASEREGCRHYQFHLALPHGATKVPLSRLYVEGGNLRIVHRTGFDRDSLDMRWLREDDLLEVSWRTLPVGSGHCVAYSLLLLQRSAHAWREIFRETGEGRYRGGWESNSWASMSFSRDEIAGSIALEREQSEFHCGEEPRPLARPSTINDGKTYYCGTLTQRSLWPCEIAGEALKVLPGKRWLDLGEDEFPLHEVAKSRVFSQPGRTYSEEDAETKLQELRHLNPSLADVGKCVGLVLVEDPLPPFRPWAGHLYYLNEK